MKKSLLEGFELNTSSAGLKTPRPEEPSASVTPVSTFPGPTSVSLPTMDPTKKGKAGRPRTYPDRILTAAEKASRYRKKHRAIKEQALVGEVPAAVLSHLDLCRAVARILNAPEDQELQQTGYPLVKELQRRLKAL